MPLKDKEARKQYAQARYLLHRDRERASRRVYYLKTRDTFLKRARERYVEKKDEILEYERNYVKKNREKVKTRQRAYHAKNVEKIKEYLVRNAERRRAVKRAWDLKNIDHVRQYRRGYIARGYELFKANLQQQLAHGIRLRLRVALTRHKRTVPIRIKKSGSAVTLLGCSIAEVIRHLEAQFQSGMSWENRSLHGWHIDHRKPLSSFNLSDPDQLAQACHYTNLQPLWAKENIVKGARL